MESMQLTIAGGVLDKECAMAMYSALLEFGVSDENFLWRTDEIGK